MTTIDVTDENFDEVSGRDGILILDFWADWCPVCKRFEPVYETVSDAHPDVVFGKVNVEAATGLAESFGLRALPTLAIFRDQVEVFFQAGALPKPDLEEVLKMVKELDMDLVRADIAKDSAGVGHAHHH